MSGIRDAIVNWRVISPENDHCFFGYYDLNAYNKMGNVHLCCRTNFIDRIPNEQDTLELGTIENNVFCKFAETTAWNFQQGALLQYKKDSDDIVFYNVRNGQNYQTIRHNIKNGEKKIYDKAVACVSPNGKYGLAINFNRIFDFRAGYGYCGVEDPYISERCPKEDGIFLVNFESGDIKLIISYEQMAQRFPSDMTLNKKLIVNHITFNESSDRFLFLLRNFQEKGEKDWGTTLITSDLCGNMHLIIENNFVSHYAWKNDKEIIAFCTPKDKPGLFVLEDMTNHATQLKSPYPEGPSDGDIHCIFSPDKRYVLGDGYPDSEGYRPLFYYDTVTEKIVKLLRSKSLADDIWDIRCDLHARFNTTGDKVSFDSVHSGIRQICEIDL